LVIILRGRRGKEFEEFKEANVLAFKQEQVGTIWEPR